MSPPSDQRGLGAAFLVLGLLRAWPDGSHLIGYARDNLTRMFYAPGLTPWGEFSGVLWGGWPILLGLLLIRGRARGLRGAAVVTALAQGIERAALLAVGWTFDSGWSGLYRGGRDPTLGPVAPRGIALVVQAASAFAWLGLAFICAKRWPEASHRAKTVPRSRRRRPMVVLAAATFAAGLMIAASWSVYITTLERLPWVRRLILSGDRTRGRRTFALDTPEMKRFREAVRLIDEGRSLQAQGEMAEARRSYTKGINRLEALVEEFPQRGWFRDRFATAANDLAWALATTPEPSLREPETAVILARKALAAEPDSRNATNTLAVAQFRAGDLDGALATFDRSMEMSEGGDSYDWFFLALIESARGHPTEAKALHDRAVAWMAENRPGDAELLSFQAEAAERLGLPKPAPPPPRVHEETNERYFPGPSRMLRRGP